jgi:resuscitation-promoting factor RpfB
VGLWRRPGLAVWLRSGLTVAAVVLLGAVLIPTDDDQSPRQEDKASAAATSSAATPTPTPTPTPTATPTPEATPEETEPPRSLVPDLTGLSRSDAEDQLAEAGLVVREFREIPSDQPIGTVLRQSRDAGASLLSGSGVVLVVAAPYPRVPDVVGLSKAVAVSRLQEAGFQVTVTSETRTSGKDGVILRQSPAGADRAKPHSSIALVVSSVVRTVAPPTNCTPGYRPCLPPASDYDCAGGSGDGPAYASGPVYVEGSDPYDLDADGDGVACES